MATDARALALRGNQQLDLMTLGRVLVQSGFFKDTRAEAQAVVKVMAGAELGFGPIASMQGIYIVEGKVSLSAGLIAAAVQRSGRFSYRVREWTDDECRIEFFEGSESLGFGSFTAAEAQRAGLAGKGPWRSYPKAMLWARAMSQGARAHCPAVFNGGIYTPEELGEEVDEEGRPVAIEAPEIKRPADAAPEITPTVAYEPAPEPPRADSRRVRLLDRLRTLRSEAVRLGLPEDRVPTIDEGADIPDLMGLGSRLRALVDEARQPADVAF
jgi:RecT family protein